MLVAEERAHRERSVSISDSMNDAPSVGAASVILASDVIALHRRLTGWPTVTTSLSSATSCSIASAFTDYGPNGLQVPGSAEVTRVATCVSAHRESIDAAVAAGAEMLLAHHGLFWDFHPRSLSEQMAGAAALGADCGADGRRLPPSA